MALKETNSSHIFDRLSAACDILDWDHVKQKWESNDGNWYSQTASQLATLERSLDLFIKSCKVGMDIQWILATNTLAFLKNILSNPEEHYIKNRISENVWQLIFELISGNSENQTKIWNECKDLLMSYLQRNSKHKDSCRLIIFNIFVIGGIGKIEAINILKILLKSYNDESEANETTKQGLNLLLENFICEEKSMSTLYLKLTTEEKIWMLQFINRYIEKGHFNVLPISVDLMICICLEFKSKSIYTSDLSFSNNIELLELMALFQVISTAANEPYYELNTYSFECFELIFKIGSIFKMAFAHAEQCENAFTTVSKNSDRQLKFVLLATISNIVKGSPKNREMARKGGLIENLVEFVAAEGADPLIYKHAVFTIIDTCHSNMANREFVVQQVNNKIHLNSEILRLLLIDINYKPKN